MRRPLLFLIRVWLYKHRGLIFVTLAALAVRLLWNLAIHRPTDFAYSDMGGYLDRANILIDRPWKPGARDPYGPGVFSWIAERVFGEPAAYLTLFPYGTHAFISGVKLLFGRNNTAAIGASFAVLGTLAVAYTYATAARFSPSRRVRRVVATILIFYYPWISLGGYALSETPFALCVAATAFYGLRLADRGRPRDAWLLGLSAVLGAIVRPQMLVAVALLGVHFLFRRRAWKHFRMGLAVRAAIPLALGLAISSARLAWHSGEWGKHPPKLGLVSTNGPMNAVFGRCHNTGLNAKAKDGGGFFGPPALGALLAYGKEHKNALFKLDPVMGESITFQGHMWDAEPTNKVSADCVRKTGYLKQAKFAITHVVLLWGYNIIWPDQGQKPKWRLPMQIFCVTHAIVILPPAAVAMLLAFRRRRARSMLLALHVWSVVVMAMLYFGDTRYRAPYDGILTVLAVVTYGEMVRALRRGFAWIWARRRRRASLRQA